MSSGRRKGDEWQELCGRLSQMQQEEESNVDSNVSCGWSALEVKLTLTFHMEVSGDCRTKRNQDSRGRRGRDAVTPGPV